MFGDVGRQVFACDREGLQCTSREGDMISRSVKWIRGECRGQERLGDF